MRRPTTFPFWSAGYPPGFTGNAAWYDASDINTMLNNAGAIPSTGEGIKLWADKSGNSSTNVLCLNGSATSYASFSALTAFGTGDFTVSIRVMPNQIAAANRLFNGAGNSFALDLNATGNPASALSGGGVNTASTSALVSFQTATVTYIRTGTTGAYYIDGVAAGTTTDSRNYSVGVTLIGIFGTTPSSAPLNGNVFWAHAYARALTGSEITADAAGTIQSTPLLNIDFSLASKLAPSFTATTGGTVTINTSGATGARISGARDLYQGMAANQPIYLPHSGTNYGYLNGVAGNFFSTPDSVPLSITGDIDVNCRVAMTDWTPSAAMALVAKFGAGGAVSWMLRLETTGALRWFASSDGTASPSAISSASVGFTDLQTGWVRVTWRASDGRTQFFTAPDADTPVWVQLGTDQTNAVGALFDSTAAVTVGQRATSTDPAAGSFYRAQIYNGIAGTLVFDFNPAAYTSGVTFLDSSSNAATITINGGATIVTKTCLYLDGSNDYLKAAAFALAQPETVYLVGSQVTWTGGDTIYNGFSTANRMQMNQPTSTPRIGLFAGGANTPVSDTFAVATNGVVTALFSGAASTLRINRGAATTGSPGTESANGFTLGATVDGTFPANITAQEVAIFSTAHNTAQQDAIILYEGRKWGVAV